jgi:hypothetical protein
VELIPLHPEFGAEVRGLDLLDAICSADKFSRLHEAFEEYSLLLLRRQTITDDLQATFARGFGALERTKVGSSGHGTFYSRMNNIGPDGNLTAHLKLYLRLLQFCRLVRFRPKAVRPSLCQQGPHGSALIRQPAIALSIR